MSVQPSPTIQHVYADFGPIILLTFLFLPGCCTVVLWNNAVMPKVQIPGLMGCGL